MATENWDRILNPDVTYEALYGTGNQGKKTVVTGGRNAFANYGEENAERENVQFIFPGATFTDIENRQHVMRRGFIRSIIFDPAIYNNYVTAGNYKSIAGQPANNLTPATPSEMSQGHHRVNFQFNPEYLERAVKQEMGTMNPLLQNPANLTQAVPGTAKFGFSLMFNRELEVQRGALKGKQLKFDYENPDFETLYKTADPETIGVLADLLIFDSIIGQGISPDTVEAINAFTNNIVNASNAVKKQVQKLDKDGKPMYDKDPNDPTGTSYIPVMVEQTGDTAFVSLMDNLNFGNSAFLNPLPVRIVFSDYFMVEGLITASTVGFQKFSKDLVPTVCTVNVAVDALYLGFAQRKAYLTNQLSIAAEAEATLAQDDQIEADSAKIQLTRYFSELSVLVNENDRTKDTINATTQREQNFDRVSEGGYLWNPEVSLNNFNSRYRFWKTNKPKGLTAKGFEFLKPALTNGSDSVYVGFVPNSDDVGAEKLRFVTLPMWILGTQTVSTSNAVGVPESDRKKNGWKKNDTQLSGYVPIQLGFKNNADNTTDTLYTWENWNPGGTAPSFSVTNSEVTIEYIDKNGNDLPDKTVTGKIECIAVKNGEITDIRTNSNGKVTQKYLVGGLQLGNKLDFGGTLAEFIFQKYNNSETIFFKTATIKISIQLNAEYKSTGGTIIPIITNPDFIQLQMGYFWDTPFVGKGIVRKSQILKSTN
jgi:hypothetical protein